MFLAMRYNEKKGHWPLMKAKQQESTISESASSHEDSAVYENKDKAAEGVSTDVRSVGS